MSSSLLWLTVRFKDEGLPVESRTCPTTCPNSFETTSINSVVVGIGFLLPDRIVETLPLSE